MATKIDIDIEKVIENAPEIEVRIGDEVARGVVLSVDWERMGYGLNDLITIRMIRTAGHDDN